MYPQYLTFLHSGIYVLERPESNSYVEIVELRPDMHVSWAQVPCTDEITDELDLRGNWAISPYTLNLFLVNEATGESFELTFTLVNDRWVNKAGNGVILRKRSDYSDLRGPFYFDSR